MKLSRCRLLAKRPLTGVWFRAVRPQFFQTALAYAHTATIPGRFNPGSTVRPASHQSQRRLIETTVQELTGDWRGYSLRNPHGVLRPPYYTSVPTQRLGAALHAVRGLEGFITYSVKVPTSANLVIFPDKLRQGSFIRFTDPAKGQVYSIP